MHLNYLAFAVPFFIGLMLIEYYFSKKKEIKIFGFEEAVANLNMGIAERITDLFSTVFFYFIFEWLFWHFALFTIRPTLLTWIALG